MSVSWVSGGGCGREQEAEPGRTRGHQLLGGEQQPPRTPCKQHVQERPRSNVLFADAASRQWAGVCTEKAVEHTERKEETLGRAWVQTPVWGGRMLQGVVPLSLRAVGRRSAAGWGGLPESGQVLR